MSQLCGPPRKKTIYSAKEIYCKTIKTLYSTIFGHVVGDRDL